MLLINASNLYVGGGVQVAISLLEEFANYEIEYIAVVSPIILSQLSPNAKVKCKLIKNTPSKIFNFKGRFELDRIVSEYRVNKVLTIFGPSYWTPKNVTHIVGFALPWLIYADKKTYSILTIKEKLKTKLLGWLQPYFYKKNADYIITETVDATKRITKLLSFSNDRIFTISNTLNAIFENENSYDYSITSMLPEKKEGEFWLLSISHDYPHKNMVVIYSLLKLLPENYKFITTLPPSFSESLSHSDKQRVITLGRVNTNQCPPLYQKCDAMFLPTLLECFSASYLEAMHMKTTIITSDRGFSRSVCGDYAYYFDPLDYNSIKDAILTVSLLDIDKKKELLSEAYKHGSGFPSAEQRAKEYIKLLNDL